MVKFSISCILFAALVGCSSDDSSSPAAPSFGPKCEKYYGSGGCCLAAAGEGAKDACTQGKKAVEDAMGRGAAPSSYEATCDQGIQVAEAAGKCK